MLTVGTQNKSWYGCSMVYYHPILITTWKADAKIPEMVFCCVGGMQADLHTELSYKHILQLNVMLQQSHVIAILIIWFFKMLLQNNEFSLSCFWDRIKSPWNLLRVKKFQLPFSICVLCRVSSNWKARHRSTHTHAIDLCFMESLYGAWQQWSGACALVWWAHKTQAHFQRIVKNFTSTNSTGLSPVVVQTIVYLRSCSML